MSGINSLLAQPAITLDETDGGKVTAKAIRALLESQAYCCAYTGEPLKPKEASVDHCNPLCDGGEHAISNLRIVHRTVNRAKGSMSLIEFVSMCRKVAAHFDGKDAT
jgi:5-methylcytosine-specific restriction endonuclease McrA